MISPREKVSYNGTVMILRPLLMPSDPEQFEKFFKFAFNCFNLDLSTAHACFRIFNDLGDPFVLGLDGGMHTIEASLAHPNTGELLDGSSEGTKMFFMTGNDDEAALFVADINIRGKVHNIPLVKGGCIVAQTKTFCASVGLEDNSLCLNPVYDHLKEIASQYGFIVDV
jgi:hypothetical protein